MRNASSIGISSRTTFWWDSPNKIKIKCSLSILVLLNVSKVQMESTFHSEMAKTLQAQLATAVSTHILVTNNQEETIWRVSDTFFYTSWRVPFHGKAFPEDQRPKSMQTLRTKRKKFRSMNCAKTSQRNLKNSCTTAEGSVSRRTPITHTWSAFSKVAWKPITSAQRHQTSSGIRIDYCWRRSKSRSRWWASSTRRSQLRNDYNILFIKFIISNRIIYLAIFACH